MSRTILIIRKFDEFSRILSGNGFEIINLPLIEAKLIKDLSDFEAKLESLKNYDGIFLTSQNAARIWVDKLSERKIKFDGKVYILGGKSFEILKDANLDLIYNESANTAQEMLENIEPDDLKQKRFLFLRGEKSLRVVPDFLKKLAKVDETVVYKTRDLTVEIDKINQLRENFARNEIAAACFFSPSAAESFLKQFGAEVLHQIVIAAIGKTTAEYFERRNLIVGFVSSKSKVKDFAVELADYLRNE